MTSEPFSRSADLLTPLEQLRLRDVLHDLWREHVRCVTELAVLLRGTDTDQVRDKTAVSVHVPVGVESVRLGLAAAKLRLAEIERAIRRLDDRSFGRCAQCGAAMPFDSLITQPERLACSSCSRPSRAINRRTVTAGTDATVVPRIDHQV